MKSYHTFQDIDLINFLKKDDERALTELYNRYWNKLLTVSLNRLQSLEAAQEIVQDIFTKLWERRGDVEISTSVSAYLAVAVKYRVIDYLDSKFYKVKNTELHEDYAVVYEPSVEEHVFQKELMRRIEESIVNLPEKCQLVFRLSRESGLTYKQIAEKLNISEKTVEAHISKAIKTIRNNLDVVSFLLFMFFYQK